MTCFDLNIIFSYYDLGYNNICTNKYVTGFLPSKTDETQLEEFSFTLRDFRDVLQFPAKPTDTRAFESLPTDAHLVDFLDEIGYEWDEKIGKVTHTVKRSRMTADGAISLPTLTNARPAR